ncbi:hypothetical protein SPHV1_400010 [Novosphingobium sp. KN65.2]|nr:hypothetical protein SPHV1_400010 [Novosphingobium sp. KN65.2]
MLPQLGEIGDPWPWSRTDQGAAKAEGIVWPQGTLAAHLLKVRIFSVQSSEPGMPCVWEREHMLLTCPGIAT